MYLSWVRPLHGAGEDLPQGAAGVGAAVVVPWLQRDGGRTRGKRVEKQVETG